MSRGRKPKPVEVKRATGNPGKRPLPDTVTIGGRVAPPMPTYLPDHAQAAWTEIVPTLSEIGMLDAVDSPALEALCIQVGLMRQATAELSTELKFGGSLVTAGSQGQARQNPLITVIANAQKEVRSWCERFGLDPSTRTRLGLQEMRKRSIAMEMQDKLGEPRLRRVQ